MGRYPPILKASGHRAFREQKLHFRCISDVNATGIQPSSHSCSFFAVSPPCCVLTYNTYPAEHGAEQAKAIAAKSSGSRKKLVRSGKEFSSWRRDVVLVPRTPSDDRRSSPLRMRRYESSGELERLNPSSKLRNIERCAYEQLFKYTEIKIVYEVLLGFVGGDEVWLGLPVE